MVRKPRGSALVRPSINFIALDSATSISTEELKAAVAKGLDRGLATREDSRHAAARRLFRSAREARPSCPSCYLPEIGVSFEHQAEPDSPIAAYEDYLDVPDAFRADSGDRDALYRAFALERLGALHEDGGRWCG